MILHNRYLWLVMKVPLKEFSLAMLAFVFIQLCVVTAHAQLFGPFIWRDGKGNCVAAIRGTIDGKSPSARKIPLEDIEGQFFGGFFAYRGDKDYVRDQMSRSEQKAFFQAIQRALDDTGMAEFRLKFSGSFTVGMGIIKGFEDSIMPLSGSPRGERCT